MFMNINELSLNLFRNTKSLLVGRRERHNLKRCNSLFKLYFMMSFYYFMIYF